MRRARFGLALAAGLLATGPSAVAQNAGTRLAVGQSLTGEISPNDAQRQSGKYEDVFTVQGRRGGRLDLRLSSDQFDPYLVVTGPDGFTLSNDDEGGSESLNSRLVLEFPADGAYRVAVTTFRPGETGAYRLEASEAAAGVQVSTASVPSRSRSAEASTAGSRKATARSRRANIATATGSPRGAASASAPR